MTFISYAQNYEDVMLWRALKHVRNGFYIDVGANDPENDSVTKAFYDNGWSGINIEPLQIHYVDLVTQRPRDINLKVAAGNSHGSIKLWECSTRGWATASSEVIAQHISKGHSGVFHTVPMQTLSSICEQYEVHEIHFLKIDVEGFEKEVIQGLDLQRFRPWIIVAEATRPNLQEDSFHEWEDLILGFRYELAYVDGLNRFYVDANKVELTSSLKYPPNIFDGFVRFEQISLGLRAERAETAVKESVQAAQAQAQQLTYQLEQTQAGEQQAKAQLQQALEVAQSAQAQISSTMSELIKLKDELHNLQQLNHHHYVQLNSTRQELEQVHNSNHNYWLLSEQYREQLQKLYASRSWRITSPMRMVMHQVYILKERGLTRRFKDLFKKIFYRSSPFLNRHPKIRAFFIRLAYGIGIADQMNSLIQDLNPLTIKNSNDAENLSNFDNTKINIELENLSPRARKIYDDLVSANCKKKKVAT